ncbi:hypothetical protein Ate02nite_05800 [Paractinoplanes tereljensis]|uniref:Uncharacterized protein n=1 Tax=Paractinoplanes tereljensis TaxID=571912 RepID=A0A919NGQ9_9ACTN|nr:hypothetical protein Ate02nite_05800 [Actinoplanes tereljensis]
MPVTGVVDHRGARGLAEVVAKHEPVGDISRRRQATADQGDGGNSGDGNNTDKRTACNGNHGRPLSQDEGYASQSPAPIAENC